ncbi:hypothetical protein E4Z66_11445 [Aliishimia ponticola]|uniref:Pilus assembly protein n=1 Tax=Aliishimia ponticola TaxID=2499833 RepID=A0A4S4NB57_9RHOB|nr:hypothetical protein [Aliishimia ponticola]THH35697.1 hypothetical protein E4Z66_11445 [Aliishimia ponticola]
MSLLSSFKRAMLRFNRDEEGSIAVEAVIILPMLFWTYLALFSTFHSYRTYAINQKAAYTIADMISRETNPIDNDYLDGTKALLRYLVNSHSSSDIAVRVTLVKYDAATKSYQRDWSQKKGDVSVASASDVAGWNTRLPEMPDNQRVIVVETFYDYDPPFNTGLEDRNVYNFVFTKPRYAPQVLWTS